MNHDAYFHFGQPRYGPVRNSLAVMNDHGIERAVLVHGPFMPDLNAINEAHRLGKGRLRCIGTPLAPWQGDDDQAAVIVDWMLEAGVIGFRLQGAEYFNCEYLLTRAGEEGRWLYAVNPQESPEHTAKLLQWLTDYPKGRVMIPHHLHLDPAWHDRPGMRELETHPRVFAILSRHGGVSREAWPHKDLEAWVRTTIDIMGWNKVCWGGEYPVLYWRNETLPDALEWLRALLPEAADHWDDFISGTASRLLFDETDWSPRERVLPEGHHYDGMDVHISQYKLPFELFDRLLPAYREMSKTREIRFHEFLSETLSRGLCPDNVVSSQSMDVS